MNLNILEHKLKNLIRKEIKNDKLKKILERLKFFLINDERLGDYSTNLIFLLNEFAPEKKEILLKKISKKFSYEFSKIEVVNNYLNFWLSDYQILKVFKNIFKSINKKNEKLFQENYGRKQKLNIDYVSANPTGPLTLGNARGAVLGDTLANILKLYGFRVTKEYYVNDRGTQIETLGKTVLAHLGYINWEKDFYQGTYLKEIAQKLKTEIDNYLNKNKLAEPELYQKIGKKVADYILKNIIKPSLKNFGTNFDWYFFESALYKKLKSVVEKVMKILKKKKLVMEKDGALFLLLSKLGEDKDEVLIKRNGEPTYFFSDILHYYYKFFFKRNKIEILIVASDHLDHTRRLKRALKILGIKNYQFVPLIYQFVHLKSGEEKLKMSKRKGIFITLDELITKINPNIARFFFLQKSPDSVIELDLELVKQRTEKNPYWYIQYAYARLNNILEKAVNKINLKIYHLDPYKVFLTIKDIPSAKIILRKIYQLQDLIYLIGREKKPHLLIEYIIDLSKKIHNFYEQEKVLPDIKKIAFVYFIKETLEFLLKLINLKPLKKI